MTLQVENPATTRADLAEELRDVRARTNCSQLSSNLPQIHNKLIYTGDLLWLSPPPCAVSVIRPEVE